MINGSLNKFRFKYWLSFFAILLLLIPIFIWQEYVFIAKISGIVLLVGLLIALKQWFAVARQINNRKERYVVNTNERYYITSLLASYKNWSKADQTILLDQLGITLTELQFAGESSLEDKLKASLYLVLATWGNSYSNKQQWLLDFNKSENSCSLYINNSLISVISLSADTVQFAPTHPLSEVGIKELSEKILNL